MQILTDQRREELIRLICRELTGHITDRDRKRLQQLEDTYGIEFPDRSEIVGRLRQKAEFNSVDPYQDFKCRVGLDQVAVERRRTGWRICISAAAIAIVAIGIWLWAGIQQEKRKTEPLLAEQIIPSGKSVATITLANGEQMELGKRMQTVNEEDGTWLKMDSAVVIYQGIPEVRKIVYHTLSIPVGGEYKLVLADGTKVWMNADSRLKYPVAFPEKQREVFLAGEAYFEVAKDCERPFIVHTSQGNIEVLGTGFNVRDYREEARVVTTLAEGKVVYHPVGRQQKIMLMPGEQVEDRGEKELTSRQVEIEMYIGWKDGKYIFENTTLEEIMQVLAKWYDVVVFYQREEVKKLHFTGDLERYENINDFLEFMEIGGNVKFNIRGKTIVIE